MTHADAISEAPRGGEAQSSGSIVCVVEGEIDMACSKELAASILAAAITTPGDVVVDMSEVSFIDSSGLSALLAVREIIEIGGRSFRIEGLQPGPRRLFELVGVMDLFGVPAS